MAPHKMQTVIGAVLKTVRKLNYGDTSKKKEGEELLPESGLTIKLDHT
ncbi:MAG: hypothetical protein WBA61_05230 [Aequorivita sp.]